MNKFHQCHDMFYFIYYNMVIQSSVLNRSMNICTCWNCKLKAVHKLKFYLTTQNISKPSIIGYEILYWEGVHRRDPHINYIGSMCSSISPWMHFLAVLPLLQLWRQHFRFIPQSVSKLQSDWHFPLTVGVELGHTPEFTPPCPWTSELKSKLFDSRKNSFCHLTLILVSCST